MKFLAISTLIGLGLLAQEGETVGYDDYVNGVFNVGLNTNLNTQTGTSSLISSIGQTTTTVNSGLQTLINSLNFFGTPTITNTPITTTSYTQQTLPSLSTNLKSEPYTTQPTQPKNPLEGLESSKWALFDNHQRFCSTPRVWDGQRCKCSNNGSYVSGKCYYQKPKQTIKDLLSLRFVNRNFDGTQNNINHPEWGAKSSDLLRLCRANYQDGKSTLWEHVPNPRDISNLVGNLQGSVVQSKLGLNMLFNIWGQFLDHDITLTPTTPDQKMNIPIPKCDKFMDKDCTGKEEFPITRSISNPNSQIKTNINVITPWNDASQVYGSDKDTSNGLREFKNGKLKTSEGNLLPKDARGSFFAGDFRVNQNVALTIFQTVFMREHNRICDQVLLKSPILSDEEVFQIARNYVIGLVQHITFDEYLPALLGKANFDAFIGQYQYDPTTSPNIYTEFSTAAFRLGHPLINAPFKLMDNWGNLIDLLELGEMFFNPSLVTPEGVNQFLNGLARTGAKERSMELVNDLRNFLFFPPSGQVKLDLFSFNVQRGRDHGICSVNAAREKMGLPKKPFKQLIEDQSKAKCLEGLYQDGSNLDLWLGIIGEKSQPGSPLGELGIRMNAFQFKKIRNSDRLWYQNVYPDAIVKEIKATSFSDVIKRNTGVKYLNVESFKKFY